MKILVTGGNGQLGREIGDLTGNYPGYRFFFTDVEELDITREEELTEFLQEMKPDVIINCAGYTAVDKAEEDQDNAFRANSKAVGNLARVSAVLNIFLVHLSTDYIFSGQNFKPYTEEDVPGPMSAYGKSKLAGEYEMISSGCNGMIIRTSWLYSSHGHNFVKTIMRFAKEKGHMRIVSDQAGTPTYAADLADTILHILPNAREIKGVEIFNFSNEGITSWYDFALLITQMSAIPCRIDPILTIEYPTAAIRPFYSVLNKEKIKKRFGLTIPHWSDSLNRCIRKIIEDLI
jgi:dTDP-4-dehydrorhamnose reductase